MKHSNPGIQWMRAVAAWMVVVDHCLFTLIDKAGSDSSLAPLAALIGGTGVSLFFVISGLVMVLSSTDRFGPAASASFVRKRLTRIIPLYWLATAIYASKLYATGVGAPLGDVVKSLLFIPYQNAQGEIQPVYGLGWTLNYEMFFYGLFAIGLIWSKRTLLSITFGGLAAAVLVGQSLSVETMAHTWPMVLYFWTRPIVLYFLAGMAIGSMIKRFPNFAGRGAPVIQALLLSSILALFSVYSAQVLQVNAGIQFLLNVAAVLIAAVSRVALARRMSSTLACRFGDASFSIYLTHSFIIGPLARLYAKADVQSPALFVMASLIVCTLVGVLSFRWIEQPIIAYFRRTA